HPRRTLVPFHLEPGVPHLDLRNVEWLTRRLLLVHATPPGRSPVARTNTATNDPAPSLHPHYRGFITTTSRSASVSPRRYSRPHRHEVSRGLRGTPSRRPLVGGSIGTRLLTFRTRAADWAHATFHTGHRLANRRAPARLIPGFTPDPGFDVV